MKLGIISDTHDEKERTATAIKLFRDHKADALIHCGDITSPDLVDLCAESDLPCYYVYGNNDFELEELDSVIESTQGHRLGFGGTIELAERSIAITHGHLKNAHIDLLQHEPHYLLYGHTHRRVDRIENSTRIINPGALQRTRLKSVAVLDLEHDNLQFLWVE